jgi:hypothetical protein
MRNWLVALATIAVIASEAATVDLSVYFPRFSGSITYSRLKKVRLRKGSTTLTFPLNKTALQRLRSARKALLKAGGSGTGRAQGDRAYVHVGRVTFTVKR